MNFQDTLDRISFLIGKNEIEKALALIKKAEIKFGNNPELLFQKALAYYFDDQYDKAIESFKTVLKINPDHYEALIYCGIAYKEINSDTQAETCWLRACEIEPDNPETFFYLGLHYQELQRWEKALKYLQESINLGNEEPDVYEFIAEIYNALGDKDKEEEYRQILNDTVNEK